MTHLVSVFSRGTSQNIEAAPVAKLETKIVRRQAALMPLKNKLAVTFIEVMEQSTDDDTTAKAVSINANGMGANNEEDIQTAIHKLEALINGGCMPPVQKVA